MRPLLLAALTAYCCWAAPGAKLSALVIDGVNNHDWATATRAIQSVLEGSGRFKVTVCSWPALPDFRGYDVVIDNFNGGHTAEGMRWPREVERALESFVREGGGLVVFHAANNAFMNWPEFNDMIGLGWRDNRFGEGIVIGPGGTVIRVPVGEGRDTGHQARHDFEIFLRDAAHPITLGLPPHWTHPSDQLTHGQHGPAQGLDILTYAFSDYTLQGEPMDWVRQYGRGRVYTTVQGHTWQNQLNPNLDDLNFQALLARGTEWAATGQVTLPANLGWRALFDGKTLEGWEPRGDCSWTALADGTLLGRRTAGAPAAAPADRKQYDAWLGHQAWLYTKAEYGEFDLHLEYWIPAGGNSGVSLRDRSRAHGAIDEPDAARPELAAFPKTTPAHIGYEIQIIDDDGEKYPTGSIYGLVAAKTAAHRPGAWNSLDIESRNSGIRVRVNGQLVAEGPGEEGRPKGGPIGLQLHDRFSMAMFRNIRIRETVR